LNLGFKSKANALFVDKNSPSYPLEGKVNIILSPALYWVKKVTLPIKYVRDVKSLIPSLFEDHLPEGKYSYFAYKEGEDFLIFAYNDKEILDLIAQKGVASANINNIYLAQSEFAQLEQPQQIDENSIIALQDGVVVKLPSALAPDATELDLSEHTYSKHVIHLTRFNQIADQKSQIVFASILGFLIVMFTTEWLITSSKTAAIIQQQTEVYSNHNLPATSFQNEAIHSKLNSTFERQSRIRDIMNLALSIKLKPTERLEHIALEKRKIVIVVKTDSEASGKRSLSKLTKRFKKSKAHFDNGMYILEVTL